MKSEQHHGRLLAAKFMEYRHVFASCVRVNNRIVISTGRCLQMTPLEICTHAAWQVLAAGVHDIWRFAFHFLVQREQYAKRHLNFSLAQLLLCAKKTSRLFVASTTVFAAVKLIVMVFMRHECLNSHVFFIRIKWKFRVATRCERTSPSKKCACVFCAHLARVHLNIVDTSNAKWETAIMFSRDAQRRIRISHSKLSSSKPKNSWNHFPRNQIFGGIGSSATTECIARSHVPIIREGIISN